MSIFGAIFGTVTVVLIASVVHSWIRLHYGQNKPNQIKSVDAQEHAELIEKAQQLAKRVQALENILDKDMPGWRDKI